MHWPGKSLYMVKFSTGYKVLNILGVSVLYKANFGCCPESSLSDIAQSPHQYLLYVVFCVYVLKV